MSPVAASSCDHRPTRAVLISVGAVQYAVIGRVLRSLAAIRPLPQTVHHESHDFPVLDLPRLFGVGKEATDDGSELILLIEQEGLRRALVVEGLAGFIDLDPSLLQPLPEIYPQEERRCWEGLLPRPDGRVLAVPRLVELPAGVAAFRRAPPDGGR